MIEGVQQFEVEAEGARQSTEFGEKETENLAPTRSENSTNASCSQSQSYIMFIFLCVFRPVSRNVQAAM